MNLQKGGFCRSILFFAAIYLLLVSLSYAATINVPLDYATIQLAVNAATPAGGDIILVAAGTYTENVTINKSLTLTGASSTTVTVNAASAANSVFTVTASFVNISGFTMSGATGGGQAGIFLGSGVANCNISNNVLTGSFDGIWLGSGSNNNTLMGNTLSSNTAQGFEIYHSDYNTFTSNIANSNTGYGFKMETASYNTFTSNIANSNTKNGFYLVKGPITGDPPGCLNNTFTNNTANSNTQYGLREDYGDHNTLTGNTFNSNVVAGIKLKEAITNLTLDNNIISGSPIGIDINFSIVVPDVTTWTVNCNNISGNTTYGISNLGTGTLNAENNWWGANNGPDDDAGVINGSGDKISTNVDADPWVGKTGTTLIPPGATPEIDIAGTDSGITIISNSNTTTYTLLASDVPDTHLGFSGLLDKTLDIDSTLPPGSFVATVKIGYTHEEVAIKGLTESELRLYKWDGANWVLAVSLNIGGTPVDRGVSPPTTTLGDYGVDTTNNIIWGNVDNFSDFAGGFTPTPVLDWLVY